MYTMQTDTALVTARLTPAELDEVKARAEKHGWKKARWVAFAVRNELARARAKEAER